MLPSLVSLTFVIKTTLVASSHKKVGIMMNGIMATLGFSCTAYQQHNKMMCMSQQIEAILKWPPFSTQHFQIHFCERKCKKFWLKFHWSIFQSPINNIPSLVQIMAWHRPGDKPLSEPLMDSLLTHICATQPQWVNSLWPSDAIWWYRFGWKLAQVIACWFTAPNHCLNQCWLVINHSGLWHSHETNFPGNTHEINL